MELLWQIEDSDIQKMKLFYDAQKNNAFVINRIERNVKRVLPEFSKEIFWKAMISCLITTQQRAGPDSAVTRFICANPFPLHYALCMGADRLDKLVEDTITNFGGLRRGKTIGEEVQYNYSWLEDKGWNIIYGIVDDLKDNQNIEKERQAAETIAESLKGFGPKQSRNLLQSLGITKYEIPVDSRITKWLTDFGFPVRLSATALSDRNYYNFVLDGFQRLCEACEIYPCVMDAIIFSSFDEEWPEDKLIW
jgi:hypothetical protein